MSVAVPPDPQVDVYSAESENEPAPQPRWVRFTPWLGRAPTLTRRQWQVLGLVASASFFELYDTYLFSLSLKQIQGGLAISEAELGFLGSLVRFGALPAFLIALFADRFGRRQVLLFTVFAYTLFTGATAFVGDAHTFVACQFFARTFAVAESLLGVVVITEEFDPAVRGWGIGALAAIQSCGAGLAALLFSFVGGIENGWRGLYLVGLGPLLLLAYLRRALPETKRFEEHRRTQMEAEQTRRVLLPLINLFRLYPKRFVIVNTVVFLLAVANAASGFLGAKYLQEAHGWSPRAVGLVTFFAGGFAVVGNTFAGWLSDHIGRKRVTLGFLLGGGIFTLAYYNAPGLLVLPAWMLMLFSLLGGNVTMAVYCSELFPTSSRSTAAGARVFMATIGESIGLALESVLYSIFQSHWMAISALITLTLFPVLIVATMFPETSGRTLEEIAPD